MKKMRIAIIGQGRSGRDIHGAFLRSSDNTLCEVTVIVEQDPERRARAAEEFGCDVLECYTELFGRTDVDLVVNASFSHQHYPITKDLLLHGFNVLSEKPFGRTLRECSELILIAKERGLTLAAFHQSLLSPAYLKVKETVQSGKLGKIHQISLRYSGFARRWDWQTLQACCAGGLYNSGPHPIGQALDLLDWDPTVKVAFSSLGTVLTSGDGDDYAKVILKGASGPVVDVEVNSADAFSKDYVFKICGAKGTLTATNSSYRMKYVEDFSVYPERPVIREPLSNAEGLPKYCSEKLTFTEEAGDVSGSSFDVAVRDFYEMLYRGVMEGAPLAIGPEKAAAVISVIEACHAENPLPVRFY